MEAALIVVGGGRMGTALVEGILSSGYLAASSIVVVEPDVERRAMLRLAHDDLILVDTPEIEHILSGGRHTGSPT